MGSGRVFQTDIDREDGYFPRRKREFYREGGLLFLREGFEGPDSRDSRPEILHGKPLGPGRSASEKNGEKGDSGLHHGLHTLLKMRQKRGRKPPPERPAKKRKRLDNHVIVKPFLQSG